jgi:hypothetical protein
MERKTNSLRRIGINEDPWPMHFEALAITSYERP